MRIILSRWLDFLNDILKRAVFHLQLSFLFMNIEKEIFHVLTEVGDTGLSIRKISIHVYNSCNSFFDDVPYEDIYNYVKQFLVRNSRNPDSVIEKTDIRGVYRLNTTLQENRQLMFRFGDDNNEEEDNSKNMEDTSLSLF